MSLDSLNAKALLLEITPQLIGSRVQKFSQLDQLNFVMHLRAPGRTNHLLFCLNPDQSRFHLLVHRPPPAIVASAFVMSGRKLFGGCWLQDLCLHAQERALSLDFSSDYRLIFDWSGLPPALIIVSPEGTCRNIHPARGRFEANKPYPLTFSPAEDPSGDELLKRLYDLPERPELAKAIQSAYPAIPPLWAKRLAKEKDLASAWDKLIAPLKKNDPHLLTPGLEADGELSFRKEVTKKFPSLNLAVAERFMANIRVPGLEIHRQELLARINKGKEKSKRKLEKRQKDLVGAQSYHRDQLCAELLLAYAGNLLARQTEFKAQDWQGDSIVISLDPSLSGPENASIYYKRAKKKKRALSLIGEQIELAKEELYFWDELSLAAELAENRTDIEEVAKSLPHHNQKKKKPAPVAPSSGPRRFEHLGFQLLVGRNPAQNEKLSLHQAAKDDHWFHVRSGAGSHVLLRSSGRKPSPQTLEAAAWLAAFYSRSSLSSSSEVVTTLARNLKKPKGSAAGKVSYRQEQTLIVNPTKAKPEGLVRVDKKGDNL